MGPDSISDLADLSRPDLLEQWEGLLDSKPSPRISRRLLILFLSNEMQWRESGRSQSDLAKRIARLAAATSRDKKPHAVQGTRLIREWNGKRHVVDVTEVGYIWQGKHWPSLSAIAREITGTRWSGPRFFGVAT